MGEVIDSCEQVVGKGVDEATQNLARVRERLNAMLYTRLAVSNWVRVQLPNLTPYDPAAAAPDPLARAAAQRVDHAPQRVRAARASCDSELRERAARASCESELLRSTLKLRVDDWAREARQRAEQLTRAVGRAASASAVVKEL